MREKCTAKNAGLKTRERNEERILIMGKVNFEAGIEFLRGSVTKTDKYYIRRYRSKNGKVRYIVQAKPDRSRHKATPAEAAKRIAFGKRYGAGRKGK